MEAPSRRAPCRPAMAVGRARGKAGGWRRRPVQSGRAVRLAAACKSQLL